METASPALLAAPSQEIVRHKQIVVFTHTHARHPLWVYMKAKIHIILFLVFKYFSQHNNSSCWTCKGFVGLKDFCQYVHACAASPVFPGCKRWRSLCSCFWCRVDMRAGSPTESGKCSRHTSPLNSYCGGERDKRDDYKLHVMKMIYKDSLCPRFRFPEFCMWHVSAAVIHVCQITCRLDKSWGWS